MNTSVLINASSPSLPKKTGLCWLMAPVYAVFFFLILLIFHPLLVLARMISYDLFNRTLVGMNEMVLWNLKVTVGTQFSIRGMREFPRDRPLLLVANHQSTYDISLLCVLFGRYLPRFVSKVELAKWIPSVSFSLRHNGSALIDRQDRTQAIREIKRAASEAEKTRAALCIFPEGTRAKDGVMKRFKSAGFTTTLKEMPSALIIPISFSRSWELLRYNLFPTPTRVRVSVLIHDPIEPGGKDPQELLKEIEGQIGSTVGELQSN